MTEADEIRRLLCLLNRFQCLDRLDVLGPWSLLPTSFGVRHSLSFLELFECHPIEVRRVEEQVLATFGVNKPKTLLRQFLDRAFCHLKSDSSKKLISAALPDITCSSYSTARPNSNRWGGSVNRQRQE